MAFSLRSRSQLGDAKYTRSEFRKDWLRGMKRDGHVPAGSLSGRDLDVAVHEEVKKRPACRVDPGDVEADDTTGGCGAAGPRPAWKAEAEEYEQHRKEVVCPRYSSALGEAMKLDTYMREEHPSPEVRSLYRELQGEDPAGISRRGLGEKTETARVNPPEICRAALRAVREANGKQKSK